MTHFWEPGIDNRRRMSDTLAHMLQGIVLLDIVVHDAKLGLKTFPVDSEGGVALAEFIDTTIASRVNLMDAKQELEDALRGYNTALGRTP